MLQLNTWALNQATEQKENPILLSIYMIVLMKNSVLSQASILYAKKSLVASASTELGMKSVFCIA